MIRSLVEKLPRPLYLVAYRVHTAIKYLSWRMRPTGDGQDPFDHVGRSTLNAIYRNLRLKPHELLQVPSVRMTLARERLRTLMAKGGAKFADKTNALIDDAIEYNFEALQSAPDLDRPAVMVKVASSIERVSQNVRNLDVLSIGPRSEIELFALHAAGFDPKKIQAIDLISYSPFVRVGDMHAMPYADNSFDMAFAGWVLAYSREPEKAAREIIRVCRQDAVLVISADYIAPSERPPGLIEGTIIESTAQLLGYFGSAVKTVYFRHDPDYPGTHMVMVAFSVKKDVA